jgi:hypothetical protein
VLAKETAMVGVVKQKTKSVGELAEHTIVMERFSTFTENQVAAKSLRDRQR